MRAGLVQLTVTDDPARNLPGTVALVRAAVAGGADFVLTPECTNALSSNRARQRTLFRAEDQDLTLAALREEAARAGIVISRRTTPASPAARQRTPSERHQDQEVDGCILEEIRAVCQQRCRADAQRSGAGWESIVHGLAHGEGIGWSYRNTRYT